MKSLRRTYAVATQRRHVHQPPHRLDHDGRQHRARQVAEQLGEQHEHEQDETGRRDPRHLRASPRRAPTPRSSTASRPRPSPPESPAAMFAAPVASSSWFGVDGVAEPGGEQAAGAQPLGQAHHARARARRRSTGGMSVSGDVGQSERRKPLRHLSDRRHPVRGEVEPGRDAGSPRPARRDPRAPGAGTVAPTNRTASAGARPPRSCGSMCAEVRGDRPRARLRTSPDSGGMPSRLGISPRTMSSTSPKTNPVTIGRDRNSAAQPMRARPPMSSPTPAPIARAEVRATARAGSPCATARRRASRTAPTPWTRARRRGAARTRAARRRSGRAGSRTGPPAPGRPRCRRSRAPAGRRAPRRRTRRAGPRRGPGVGSAASRTRPAPSGRCPSSPGPLVPRVHRPFTRQTANGSGTGSATQSWTSTPGIRAERRS